MKILIPFSGGINSTYSLYRWLTETDVDIVARGAYDKFESEEYNSREIKKLREIVIFLKSEVRDFDFQMVNWSIDYVEERIPIRPGFSSKYNVGALKPRYETFPLWIKETDADAISIGVSLENTALDVGYNTLRSIVEPTGVDIYLAGIRDLTPVPQGDDFDWDDISLKIIGRFEQYESIPKELQSLVVKCDLNTCEDNQCRTCAYQRTYEKFISEGKTGRDFDLYCAKKGSYGPWRHEADPKTYYYRGALKRRNGENDKKTALPYLTYK
jgi:hypothetical protein